MGESGSHRRARRIVVLTAIAALTGAMLAATPPSVSAASTNHLFTSGPESRAATPQMLRTRSARLVPALQSEPGPIEATVNLFDDVAVPVTLERRPGTDPAVWTGAIPGRPGTSVLIVLSDGYVFGNVHLGGAGEYTLAGGDGGNIVIGQIDPSSLGVEVGPVPVPEDASPAAPGADRDADAPPGARAQPRIDVMIVWSVEVLNDKFGGSEPAGRAWAKTRIAELNTILADSEVDATARLAFAGTAEYDDGENSEASLLEDLKNFTFVDGQDCNGEGECDPEGHLDTEREQRELVGADIAVLVVEDSDEFGIAWGNCRPGDPPHPSLGACIEDYAFAVVEYDAASAFFTMAHEVGHLLGGTHDSANGGSDYARGYKVSGKFSTVVAYECAPGPSDCAARVGFYSNPDLIWPGDSVTPMGKAIGDPAEADNVTHFNLSTDVVAGFWRLATCHGATPTILGTAGADVITGTGIADVIMSFGGDDQISSRDGNDRVCAGGGDDEIDGGAGSDRLYGDAGADKVIGGGGGDYLFGNGGDDVLKGGKDNDVLNGGAGTDTLNGGAGAHDVCKKGETNKKCETVRSVRQ